MWHTVKPRFDRLACSNSCGPWKPEPVAAPDVYTCPNCGNADRATIADNGQGEPDLLLCCQCGQEWHPTDARGD